MIQGYPSQNRINSAHPLVFVSKSVGSSTMIDFFKCNCRFIGPYISLDNNMQMKNAFVSFIDNMKVRKSSHRINISCFYQLKNPQIFLEKKGQFGMDNLT